MPHGALLSLFTFWHPHQDGVNLLMALLSDGLADEQLPCQPILPSLVCTIVRLSALRLPAMIMIRLAASMIIQTSSMAVTMKLLCCKLGSISTFNRQAYFALSSGLYSSFLLAEHLPDDVAAHASSQRGFNRLSKVCHQVDVLCCRSCLVEMSFNCSIWQPLQGAIEPIACPNPAGSYLYHLPSWNAFSSLVLLLTWLQ